MNVPGFGLANGEITGSGDRAAFDSAALFEVHAEFAQLSQALLEGRRTLSEVLEAERSEVELLTDIGRRIEEEVRDAKRQVETLGAALDRIKMVALNTGLEGARLGDLVGKVLVGVSDELRQLTARGLELLLEQSSSLEQLEMERPRLASLTERSRQQVSALDSLRQLATQLEEHARRSLGKLSTELERGTGLDAEAQARVTSATEQARGLVSTLQGLSTDEQRRIARDALLSELGPILRFLSSGLGASP